MKVYGSHGYAIGKVKEVYLAQDKIYGLLIKVDRHLSYAIGKRNLLIVHKHIYSIADVVMLDKESSEHIEKIRLAKK